MPDPDRLAAVTEALLGAAPGVFYNGVSMCVSDASTFLAPAVLPVIDRAVAEALEEEAQLQREKTADLLPDIAKDLAHAMADRLTMRARKLRAEADRLDGGAGREGGRER